MKCYVAIYSQLLATILSLINSDIAAGAFVIRSNIGMNYTSYGEWLEPDPPEYPFSRLEVLYSDTLNRNDIVEVEDEILEVQRFKSDSASLLGSSQGLSAGFAGIYHRAEDGKVINLGGVVSANWSTYTTDSDWRHGYPEENSTKIYNSGSVHFEGDFNLPEGGGVLQFAGFASASGEWAESDIVLTIENTLGEPRHQFQLSHLNLPEYGLVQSGLSSHVFMPGDKLKVLVVPHGEPQRSTTRPGNTSANGYLNWTVSYAFPGESPDEPIVLEEGGFKTATVGRLGITAPLYVGAAATLPTGAPSSSFEVHCLDNSIAEFRIPVATGAESKLFSIQANNETVVYESGQVLDLESAFSSDVSRFTIRAVDGLSLGDVTAGLPFLHAFKFVNVGVATIVERPVVATADYDRDGIVDGSDFLTWQRSYGSLDLSADGNGDGAVDAADLELWRATFGHGVSSTNAKPVPEPCVMHAYWSLVAGTVFAIRNRRPQG